MNHIENQTNILDFCKYIYSRYLVKKGEQISFKQILQFCNSHINHQWYYSFNIPKRSGGSREVYAPKGALKTIQTIISEDLNLLYTPSDCAMGFVKGRSILDNARFHTNQNYVFTVDLKDFFTSIDQARVWKRLQLPPFNLPVKIASAVAGMCSIKTVRQTASVTEVAYVLPQGAPTSPLLSNAICDTLDRRLSGLAKRFGLHYSRYADDITFSSMHNVYQSNSEFRTELQRIIQGQNFTINEEKTRLQHRTRRQSVTGIIVGRKANVPKEFVKDLRAILHIWKKYGKSAAQASMFPNYMSNKPFQIAFPNIEQIISGRLCYMRMIKGKNDPLYQKLYSQFCRIKDKKLDKSNAPRTTSGIEYIFTMRQQEFESKLGVKIKYEISKSDFNRYAIFNYNGRTFKVIISKNMQKSKDTNPMISLVQIPYKTHHTKSVYTFYYIHRDDKRLLKKHIDD